MPSGASGRFQHMQGAHRVHGEVCSWILDRRSDGHLCGKVIAPEHLKTVLREGYQRQRAAAALELAIYRPREPLFEVRAPGWKQRV